MHRWALVTAAAVTLLASWTFIAIGVSASAGTGRVAAREPVFVTEEQAANAVARWMIHADYIDNRQFLLLYVMPLRSDVAPPPGLPRWPAPGEVFLSPALLNSPGSDVVKHRYGRFAGQISQEGLAHPGERLAYYRPPTDKPFVERLGITAISGFGVDPAAFGSTLDPNSIDGFGKWNALDVYILVALVVALPAAVLLVLAVRSNSERRERRLAMLDALGAPSTARAVVLIGEAALPVIAGTAVGAAAAMLSTLGDMTVPLTSYTVTASDLAVARWWLIVVALGVVAGTCGLVVLIQLRGAATGQTRPRKVRRRFRGWLQSFFPISLALAIWGAMVARGARSLDQSPGLIVFMIAVALVLISLPAVLGSAAAVAGKVLAKLGTFFGRPSAIVGGSWLAHRPAMIARLCAAFVVGLGLLVQVQVQQTWIIEQTRGLANGVAPDALTVGNSMIVIRSGADDADLAAFASGVGRDNVLIMAEDGPNGTLVGSCTALHRIGDIRDDCPTTRTPVEATYSRLNLLGNITRQGTLISKPDLAVATQRPSEAKVTGLFVINTEASAGVNRIAAAAYATLPKPYVSTPGQEWIAGGLHGAAVFNWVLSFGLAGFVILALAGALASASLFLSQASSLGVLGTYTAKSRFYVGIALWNLGIPLIAAGLVGSAVAAFLGVLTLQIRQTGHLSTLVLAGGLVVACTLAIILTAICGLSAARSVRRWRPMAD